MLCKNNSAVFYNTTALPGTITSIEFLTGSNASATAVYYAEVFAEEHAASIESGHEFTGKATTSVYNVPEATVGSFFNLSLLNNSKNGQIEHIIITIKL